jgi:DNA-binding NarL/FixJ family response regulator
MIRVMIVDDRVLERSGERALLSRPSDITVVGEARNGVEAVQLAKQLHPDVILMDLDMPRLDGIRATQHIVSRRPRAQVLIVSMARSEARLRAALQHGARGYLAKDNLARELVPATRALHQGHPYFSQLISQQFSEVIASQHILRTEGRKRLEELFRTLTISLDQAKQRSTRACEEATAACRRATVLCVQLRRTRAEMHRLIERRQLLPLPNPPSWHKATPPFSIR